MDAFVCIWLYKCADVVPLCCLNTLNFFPRRDKLDLHTAMLTEESSSPDGALFWYPALIWAWPSVLESSGCRWIKWLK